MKMTITYAAQRFGALPDVPIALTRATTFLGKVRYRRERRIFGHLRNVDFQIRLSSEFDLPENEWDDVIIHEMIHYHIALNNLRDTSTHGVVFRGIMDEINRKYDRHITVSHTRLRLRPPHREWRVNGGTASASRNFRTEQKE